MRRIILTEEEKKRIELRANSKTKTAQLRRWQKKYKAFNAKKGRDDLHVGREAIPCPYCGRKYSKISSSSAGHPGFCRKKCFIAVHGKEAFKGALRQNKQIRRQERIKSPEKCPFYESREWRELRWKVLRHFGFSCMACGRSKEKHGVTMHVDHVKPRSKYPDLELDFDNLQVLCEDCNLGKSNTFEDDFRPGSK